MDTKIEGSISESSNACKGCQYIYAPAGAAEEYAPLAANPYRGCGHGCAYCYAPGVLKMKRTEFDAGALPRPEYITLLTKDAKKYQKAGITDQVLLSFTTDPYHPGDTSLTRQAIEVIQAHGLGVCTLTKGGTRSVRDLNLFRPARDAFASTLTSLDDAFSLKWERGAALPGNRLAALRKFHNAGIFTWVSLEPTIDIDSSLNIVRETHDFVDLYKIGKANYMAAITKTTDWRGYILRMVDICTRLGVAHYIKEGLQEFLPPGYHNPMRVIQCHPGTAKAIPVASETVPEVTSTALETKAPPKELLEAFTLSSAELGTLIKKSTAYITKRFGSALAYQAQAKGELTKAQHEFKRNVAFYYEAKRRLLNPGYRTDVDGGKDRTPDENQKNFGAPDWASFIKKCATYSLQHADRLLKVFCEANGLPSCSGSELDDAESAAPKRRRLIEDQSVQRRYKIIATTAIEIASRNPEGEIEKLILAAAERAPGPPLPFPSEIHAEILSFVRRVLSSATDSDLRDEAMSLVDKLHWYEPLSTAVEDLVVAQAISATIPDA
jgi:DNA repair photolyase